MTKLLFVILVMGLLLGGCGSKSYWTKPDFTAEQWKIDHYVCDYNANMYCYRTDGVGHALCWRNNISMCLRARGYEYVKQ
jgi:uncharacterized protein YceK